MVGWVDAWNDGFGFPIGRGRVVIAFSVNGFAGFTVDVEDFGHDSFFWFGIRLLCRFSGFGLRLMVSFPVVLQHAVLALEGATGGGEVAQDEVVLPDLFG